MPHLNGTIVSTVGSAIALLGFFLPWYQVPTTAISGSGGKLAIGLIRNMLTRKNPPQAARF